MLGLQASPRTGKPLKEEGGTGCRISEGSVEGLQGVGLAGWLPAGVIREQLQGPGAGELPAVYWKGLLRAANGLSPFCRRREHRISPPG